MKKVTKSRIEQLAEQCENWYLVEGGFADLEFQYEKFARLIIQECVDVMNNDTVEKVMSLYYSKRIRRHFGVEE